MCSGCMIAERFDFTPILAIQSNGKAGWLPGRGVVYPMTSIGRRQFLGNGLLGLSLCGLPGQGMCFSPSGRQEKVDASDAGLKEFTDDSRAAIERGNAWLIKAINRDGGAGLDLSTPSDVACTSVVGLAFLSQGQTPGEGEHRQRQAAILEFLLKRVEGMGSGGALQSTASQIEGDLGPFATHFFATICLSQMLGESDNVDRVRRAVQRLVNYISANQLKDGSWGTNAWAPQLATASGWVSLRAANFAGIKVSGSAEKSGEYMIRTMPRLGDSWGSGSWYHRLYGTAAGLRVLYSLGLENDEKARQSLADILALVEGSNRAFGGAGGEEYLTFHFMTEMLMQMGGSNWARWYPNVRDRLVAVQNRDGSWTGHHCITSRTFSTACAMLVLTAPNRFLPISQI